METMLINNNDIIEVSKPRIISIFDGREFFYWDEKGITLCDSSGFVKHYSKDDISNNNTSSEDKENLYIGIYNYVEEYTNNKIIVSKDDRLAAVIQSIPSREDITEPSYKVDVFAKDLNTRLYFSFMIVVGDKNITTFIDSWNQGGYSDIINQYPD